MILSDNLFSSQRLLLLDALSRAFFGFSIIIIISWVWGFELLSTYGSAIVSGGFLWLVGSLQYEKSILNKNYSNFSNFLKSILLRSLFFICIVVVVFCFFYKHLNYLEYTLIFCMSLFWQFLDGFLKSRGIFSKPSLIKFYVRSIFFILKIYVIINYELMHLFLVIALEGVLIFLALLNVCKNSFFKEDSLNANNSNSSYSTSLALEARTAFLGWLNFINNNFYILIGPLIIENIVMGIFYFYMRLVDLGALLANPIQLKTTYKLRKNNIDIEYIKSINKKLIYVWFLCSIVLLLGFLYRYFSTELLKYEFISMMLMMLAALPFVLASMRVPYLVLKKAVISGIFQGFLTLFISLTLTALYLNNSNIDSQLILLSVCLLVTRLCIGILSPLFFSDGRKFLVWQYFSKK